MTRGLLELAQMATTQGLTLEDLRRIYVADPQKAAAAYQLWPEERAELDAMPDDFDVMHRVFSRNEVRAVESYGLDEFWINLLRALPPPPPHGPGPQGATTKPGAPGYALNGSTGKGKRHSSKGERLMQSLLVGDGLSEAGEIATKGGPRVGKPRLMVAAKARIQRRQLTHRYPDAGVLQFGASAQDVFAWYRRACFSNDETERAVARGTRKHRWAVRAMLYTLWHIAVETQRSAMLGVVAGYSRDMLAKICPARGRNGGPMHDDRVSHAMRELREALPTLFMYWQPDPATVRDGRLPGVLHHMTDNTLQWQAMNIYWFVPARKTAAAPDPRQLGSPVDRPRLYTDLNNLEALAASANLRREKVSAARAPPTSSGPPEPPEGVSSGPQSKVRPL